jgi:hypothetical protein
MEQMNPEEKSLFQINTERDLFQMRTELMLVGSTVQTIQKILDTGNGFSQLDDVSSRRLACIIFIMLAQIRTFFLSNVISYDFIPAWVQFLFRMAAICWLLWDMFQFRKEMSYLDEVRKVAIRRIRGIYGYEEEENSCPQKK